MRAFRYARPESIEAAVALLVQEGEKAAVLAGGTDLIGLMKDDVVAPSLLISLQRIASLRGIRKEPAGGLRVGATVTLDELAHDPVVRREFPSLVQAVEGIASPQIRSAGTVAGDLCQRPRCWYFRSGFGLLAMRDGRSLVAEGDNRYHAILGNLGWARYVHPSGLAPALIALDARIVLEGSSGARILPLSDFFVTPAKEGEVENVMGPGELVREIEVPPAAGFANATYEVRQRAALDWPLAAAAVALALEGGLVKSARIVLGHVAPVPWRAPSAEKLATGKPLDRALCRAAGEAAVASAAALSRNAYKIRLATVAVERAMLRAAGLEGR